MAKRFNEKRQKQALAALDKELDSGYGKVDESANAAFDARDAAMGKGEEELFERKLTKEEKKAAAKAAREAKKKSKVSKSKDGDSNGGSPQSNGGTAEGAENGGMTPRSVKSELDLQSALEDALKNTSGDDGVNDIEQRKRDAALEWLSAQNINVTYEAKKGKLHANTRDINVSGVTVNFHGKPLIEDTELVINYGNRYGFIGPNGSGKSTSTFAGF